MRRYGQVIGVKPEHIDAYERIHREAGVTIRTGALVEKRELMRVNSTGVRRNAFLSERPVASKKPALPSPKTAADTCAITLRCKSSDPKPTNCSVGAPE